MTCHTGGDSPMLDPANPNFLRGGPYETRNDICWNCHLQEEFSRLNPHEDIKSGRAASSATTRNPTGTSRSTSRR